MQTQNQVPGDYAEAFVGAAVDLGATVLHVDVSGPRHAPPSEMGGAIEVNAAPWSA